MFNLNGENLTLAVCLEEIKSSVGSSVTLNACVHKVRQMSGFAFVILRTGRYVFQSVYSADTCTDSIENVKEGCYVTVTGKVKEDKRANYGIEILLQTITVLSKPAADYPLHVSDRRLGCSIETNLDYRSVALRNPFERAVFKLSEGIVSGFREFMLKEGFTEIHTPKIVSAGAEGGANIFKLKYFDKDAFLAQSPQFYKQTCIAFFDRVFEIAPVYRAEKHNTSRHLNEYIGLDFEMGFIKDMGDVMNMETAMLKYVIHFLKENYENELTITGAVLPVITDIPVFSFFEALEAIGSRPNKYDLDPEDEVKLCDYAKEKYGSEFVFITHYPASKRPFYAMDNPENTKLAESFDLLFRGLEVTTGGQRIHSYEDQVAKMQSMGLNPEDFSSYLEAHKYGLPPHGGLGIGLERLAMKLLGLTNIRQSSLFPRDLTHLDP
ncbi:MAG: aspartate--tRNA(Asn) ligase [Clostridiales bacterium 43-6]|nr:MAG: aspartate--tRNA(Asn) ligase [Clostridiales bacterium 43-6]